MKIVTHPNTPKKKVENTRPSHNGYKRCKEIRDKKDHNKIIKIVMPSGLDRYVRPDKEL